MVEQASRKSDAPFYILAVMLGLFAGWVGIEVGDLLFTAFLVLAPCMLLGALRPERPWRWVVIVGALVPLVQLAAYLFRAEKPYRAQIWEAFLAWFPGIAGAYGGSLLRGVVDNLLQGK